MTEFIDKAKAIYQERFSECPGYNLIEFNDYLVSHIFVGLGSMYYVELKREPTKMELQNFLNFEIERAIYRTGLKQNCLVLERKVERQHGVLGTVCDSMLASIAAIKDVIVNFVCEIKNKIKNMIGTFCKDVILDNLFSQGRSSDGT